MTGQALPLAADVAAAVRRRYADDADEVLRMLGGLESDRVQVAVLVGAGAQGGAVSAVRVLVDLAVIDWRDVLMVEYSELVDYLGELRRLGLQRPYPV